MKAKYSFSFLASAVCVGSLIMLPACKPTEKNYQDAYAIARHKKASLRQDNDLDLSQLVLEEGPNSQIIDGQEVFYESVPIKSLNPSIDVQNYNIAVGRYKMETNATAHADRLRAEGFDAFVAQTAKDVLYVICATYSSREDALQMLSKISASGSEISYPGLDGHPVLIYNPIK